jgi:hypothetical protein
MVDMDMACQACTGGLSNADSALGASSVRQVPSRYIINRLADADARIRVERPD